MAGERRNVVAYFSTQGWNEVRSDLNSLGDKGQQVFDRIAKAARGVDAPLKGVNQASRELRGSMESMASRAGVVGNVLASIGPKGLAAAAAIGAVTLAARSGLQAFAEEERGLLRLDAVLRATGNTAGLTRDQMSDLAEQLERTTFFPKEEVLQAEAALASFKAVSGSAFESTIRLAVDLSEVMGGDVVSNARLLGKALQDPAEGFDMLKRKIGEINPEIAANAEALANSGKKAEAVDLIIGELQAKMGGAATEAASGYAGAVNNLGDAFSDLFKSIGQLIAESGLTTYLQNLGYGIDAITEGIKNLKGLLGAGDGQAEWEQKARSLGYATSVTFASSGGASGRTKEQIEADKKAAKDAVSSRAAMKREIDDLRAEQEALLRGGDKEVEIQRKLNQFLSNTKGLRKDEVKILAQQYEQQLRIGQAQQEQYEAMKKAQKEYEQIFTHASERIHDVFADSFSDIFENGLDSFADLGKKIKSIMFKTAGEIAAAMVFRPIVSPIMGSLLPSISGSVLGGSAGSSASGAGGIGNLLSGGSSLYSLLSGGLNANLGGSFVSLGQMLGYGGIDNAAALYSLGSNFTAGAGLASFGGNMLGNLLLGDRGIGSTIGGTIGGIAGTVLGGPIGGFVGSLAGNALGGMFGGGKPHPGASFQGNYLGDGTFQQTSLLSKHMDTTVAQAVSNQMQAFMAGLTSLYGANSLKAGQLTGIFGSDGSGSLSFENGNTFAGSVFDPTSDSSLLAAMKHVALTMATTADVVNNDLVNALRNMNTEGKTAADALANLVNKMAMVQGLNQLADSLTSNAATTNLSPESYYNLMKSQLSDVYGMAGKGDASLEQVTAAVAAFLDASQSYAGRASGFYASDLSGTQDRLRQLATTAPRFAGGGDFGGGVRLVGESGTEMEFTGPSRIIKASETRRLLAQGSGLVDEFSRYREQSASETMQLARGIEALRQEMAGIKSMLVRVTAA